MTIKLNPGIIALIVILSLLVLTGIGLIIYAHLHYRNGKIMSDCRQLNNCDSNEICDNNTGECIQPGKLGGKCFNIHPSPAGELGGRCRGSYPVCDYPPEPISPAFPIEPGPVMPASSPSPSSSSPSPSSSSPSPSPSPSPLHKPYECSNKNICVAPTGELGGECRKTTT